MDEMRDIDESRASNVEAEQQELHRDQDDRNGVRKGKGFFRKKVCRFFLIFNIIRQNFT